MTTWTTLTKLELEQAYRPSEEFLQDTGVINHHDETLVEEEVQAIKTEGNKKYGGKQGKNEDNSK